MKLKFRAWNKEHKRFYLVTGISIDYIGDENEYTLLDDRNNLLEVLLVGEDEVIIEQYTGVRDIYIGDIVEHITYTTTGEQTTEHSVIYDMYTARFLIDPNVIGNIHENEELLQ